MQTCQPKVLTPTTSPIAFYTLATVPCSNHRGQIPDNQDSLWAAGPIFPERAESRIKTLGGSPAPSASWQTPVFLHVVLHGLWFLSMCEYIKKKPSFFMTVISVSACLAISDENKSKYP